MYVFVDDEPVLSVLLGASPLLVLQYSQRIQYLNVRGLAQLIKLVKARSKSCKPAFADTETADDWLQHLHHFDSVVPEIRKRIIEIHSRQTQYLNSRRSTDRPLKDGDFVRIKKRTDDSNLAKTLPTWSDEAFAVTGTDGHGNHTLATLQGKGVPQVYPRHLLKNVRKPEPDSTSASGDSNDSTLPPITSLVQKLPLRDGKQWYVVRRKGLVTTFEVEASELGARRRHEFDKRLQGEARQ